MKLEIRRPSAVAVFLGIALVVATSGSAATVVSFVVARSGETLIVSNPHASAVTGQIRVIPDAGTSALLPLSFSVPTQGTQPFPNVLSNFGSSSSPAILAVESTDTVNVSSASLHVAYPERPITLAVLFDPQTPATGSLILGILSGLIQVNIYEHPTSAAPLASRTISSSGEEVTRLRYRDLLPAGVAISDGYATVTPLSGQAVATAENPSTRRHAAGRLAPPPPILSITGGPACEFSTGIHASVPLTADATYRWTLLNATAQGALTGNALDLAPGSQRYTSIALETTINDSPTTAEANIRIDAKPVYLSSTATSVTLGQDATIRWTLAGGTPTAQTLSGSDFPVVSLEASATSYTFHPTSVGPKSYSLSASNACGVNGSTGTYSVSAACTTPDASVSVPASVPPNTTFTASMPAGAETYQWQVTGSGSIVSGATSAVVTILSGASGTLSVTGSAQNSTCTATDTKVVAISPPMPAITNVRVLPNPVLLGGLAAIEFTTSNTTSWAISSAIGNGFTSDPPHAGSGDGAHFVIYSAANNDGQETMTITATGPGGPTTQTLGFLVSDTAPNTPPTISSVVATNTPSGLTLTYTLSGANYWVIDPPLCSPGSGRGSGTFTAQCSATRFSEQHYSAYGIGNTGYDGGTVLTVYVSAPSSVASNTTFAASMGPNHSGYSWSVTNGTVISGQGTPTATIRAGTAGTALTIEGTASNGACCMAIDTVTVTVNP